MRSNFLLTIASVATATIAAPAFQPPVARDVTKETAGPGDDTIARCCDGSIIFYPNICMMRCPPATPFRESPVVRDFESGAGVGIWPPPPDCDSKKPEVYCIESPPHTS